MKKMIVRVGVFLYVSGTSFPFVSVPVFLYYFDVSFRGEREEEEGEMCIGD